MQKKIIAIFGGSFNPPINSHISLAKQIIEKGKNIDKLVFVPVSTKYKKLGLESDSHRYNMLKLICDKEEKLEVSDIEIKKNKQLYTIQTLDLLKAQYGKDYEFYFVMGTDNLKEVETWMEANRLLKDYKIIVLGRENDNIENIIKNNDFLNKNKQSLIEIDGIERIFLSSTIVREKIKNKEDVTDFIDKDVLEYIEKNELYK